MAARVAKAKGLAPSHLRGAGVRVRPGDMMVNANFRAAKAREKRLGVIRARAVRAVSLLMIDALRSDSESAARPNAGPSRT